MQLQIIHALPPNGPLASEWNELLTVSSASHVPFLRYEYLSAWWQTKGGGEWPQAELATVIGRDEAGKLKAAAPLFFAQNRQEIPALLLLGSIEISDYLDLLVAEVDLPEFLANLLTLLEQGDLPAWQLLDWYNLPEESPTLPALKGEAEKRGWRFEEERLQPCPYIPLPGDWETYLAGLDKKQRHEVRRKMRRAEEAAPAPRWYMVTAETVSEADLDAEMDQFMGLMAMDPEKERFLTPAMREQMRLSAHAAYHGGWLQLAFIEVGGQKAAGYFNFDFANHIWVYNSGLNFNLRELSPGWVLLGNLLRWANENRRDTLDFMRGGEDYKYRFGGINRYVVRAMLDRRR